MEIRNGAGLFRGIDLFCRIFSLEVSFPARTLIHLSAGSSLAKTAEIYLKPTYPLKKLFLGIQFFTSFLDIPGDPGTEVGYCFAEAFVFVERRGDAG